MRNVKVIAMGGAYCDEAELHDSGLIYYPKKNSYSTIQQELIQHKTIKGIIEVKPEVSLETKLPQEKLAQTQKKRGRKPVNESGN